MTLTQVKKAGLDEIALDHVFTIGASGSSAYTFQGEGLNGTVNNPTLYLTRGKTYRFENGSGGHPFRIQSTTGTSGTAYNTGVTNNNTVGTVIVEVQHDAPDVLYYQCTSHAAMNGILYITGALPDGGVTTAKIADDAVTNDKLANSVVASIAANTAKTSNATHTGDVTGSTSLTIANNAVTEAKIATGAVTGAKIATGAVGGAKISNGAVTNAQVDDNAGIVGTKLANNTIGAAQIAAGAITNTEIDSSAAIAGSKLADDSISLAKLQHGTSSENGKFLRANNGADPTFESIPAGTTINSQADNRLITCSGTTDTLNAETALIWTGTTLSVGNAGVTEYNPSSAASTMTVGDMSTGINRGITIISHSGGNGGLHFGDPQDDTAGAISYVHNGDYMRFFAASGQRANITQHGLTFGTDTAEANALDEYEEGSYTVSVQGDSSVQLSYSYRQANYVKIGKYVFVAFDVRGSRNNMNGQVYMSLPFTSMASGGTAGGGACNVWAIGTSAHYGIHVQVDNNTGFAYFTYQWSNNNTSGLTGNLFYSNTQLRGQFAYIAAS